MLDRACFAKSLASGKRIDLQLNHDAATVAASTANGLELEESEIGLLFRIDLRHVKNAAILSRMVDAGSHACASVAYSVVSDRTEKFGGHPVRIITEAALKEVSLVPRGAIKQAFVFLSDTVNTPTIIGMERSAVFALDRAAHNVRRATNTIRDNTTQLSARIGRLCEQAGISLT
jgi:HK97 family phage prohead protease